MFKDIKTQWHYYRKQIVATFILLSLSMIFGLLQEWGFGYALLVGILIYDLCLIRQDEHTITKWARRQLPGWLDKVLMVVLWALVVKYGACGDGWGASYWFMVGTINGHINWES